MKTELKIAQSECIRFCLELLSRGLIKPSHFRKINWLLVEEKVELCTFTSVFKYCKGITPCYQNDMFIPSLNNYNTRSQMWLDIPLSLQNNWRTKKYLASWTLVPRIWNKISSNKYKDSCNCSFFHAVFEKNFLLNCKSEQFSWFFIIIFFIYLFIYFFIHLSVFWQLIVFLLYFFALIALGEP